MLEDEFSLVMLTEQMAASLVLLAHELCLPLYRVAALTKNARRHTSEVRSEDETNQMLQPGLPAAPQVSSSCLPDLNSTRVSKLEK